MIHITRLVYQFRWNFVTRQKKTRVEEQRKKKQHKDFYHDDEWAQLSESRRTIALHYVEQKASKTVPYKHKKFNLNIFSKQCGN